MAYDVIVIGSGPAGMSASLFLRRTNLKVLIIEKKAPGGKVLSTTFIDNYPGFRKNTGLDLATIMYQQVKELRIPFAFHEVLDLYYKDPSDPNSNFIVKTNKNEFETRYVVFAGGTTSKPLNIPNESEFVGRGLSFCAICDGNFYEDKEVTVIGGGNTAFEEAIYLSQICKKVTLIARSAHFSAEPILIEKAKSKPNMVLYNNMNLVAFKGERMLTQIVVEDKETKKIQEFSTDGVFAYVGYIPSTCFLKHFNVLNDKGYIKCDENRATIVPRLYAAGDCVDKPLRQIITAVADGAICAAAIIRSL